LALLKSLYSNISQYIFQVWHSKYY
jgi:hypothetical protein